MAYRNPQECPHTTVSLNRETEEQRCGQCGTIVVPGRPRLAEDMEWDLQITARGSRYIQVPKVKCRPSCVYCGH